jgi:hypothetical protein
MTPVERRKQNMTRGPRQLTLSRVVQARRRLETLPQAGGRVWINGREVGGANARYIHLGQTHD